MISSIYAEDPKLPDHYKQQIKEKLFIYPKNKLSKFAKKCKIKNIAKKKKDILIKEIIEHLEYYLYRLFDDNMLNAIINPDTFHLIIPNRDDLSKIDITKAIIMGIGETSEIFENFYCLPQTIKTFDRYYNEDLSFTYDEKENSVIFYFQNIELGIDWQSTIYFWDKYNEIEIYSEIKTLWGTNADNYDNNGSFILNNIYNEKVFDLINDVLEMKEKIQKDIKGWWKNPIKQSIKEIKKN